MEKNYFEIVKYKKRNNFEYEVVPSSWVIGTKVYFPKDNMKTMIKDAKTQPEVDNWLSYQMARIKRKEYEDYNEAVIMLYKMLEDAEGQDIHENQLETRSMKHNVSQASNRMVQLQLPPVLQTVESEMPSIKSPKMEPEPKSPEMTNTSENLEDYEDAAAGANSNQYQEDTQGLDYLELQDANTPTRIPAIPLNKNNNVETTLSVQPNFTAGETYIIGQLKQLSTKLIDLTNAVNMIMSSIETSNSKNELGGGSGGGVLKILTEEKLIRNEASLNQFEKQSHEREKQLRLELLARIGKRQPAEVRSCCLELCDLLICHEFWQYTSWAGGTKDEGKPKFALQDHQIFLNFFKDIVREATNASFSDKEFAVFFQSKMKNRNQLPTKLRRTASRNRNSKNKRLKMSSDVREYKYGDYLEDESD